MIKANELRIGNKVAMGVHICTINSIHLVPGIDEVHYRVSGFVKFDQYAVYDYQVDPIPLTPEILDRCGFKKTKFKWRIDEGDAFYLYGSNGFYAPFVMPEIKYLHQLQNIYYAMTGEELEYKPEMAHENGRPNKKP